MTAPQQPTASRPGRTDVLRPLRRRAAVAWLGWALAVGLLWGQHQAGVLHPYALLFLFLLALTAVSSAWGLLGGLWRALRGPRRGAALLWGVACFLPAGLWLALTGYALAESARANAPNNLPWRLAAMATASAMEAEAAYAYPYRLETERLVMFYDDRVTRPHADAEAMDRHVAQLEALTGRPLREKIHWVRGRLLGRGRLACYGLALGSDASPRDWESVDHPDLPDPRLSVDRHELAHAVLHQHCEPDTDPPLLLVEGWADSQAGPTPQRRAAWAVESRALWLERTGGDRKASYLRELVGPDWYHRIGGPVYNVGGAFAEYLLRHYGVERFLQLYFACRPGTFEQECRAVLGVDLDTLERRFWEEAELLARAPPPQKAR